MEGESTNNNIRAWVLHLWRGILFPLRSEEDSSTIRWQWIALFYLLGAVLCFGNLHHAFFEPDETRYAEIPREMLAKDQWVIPTLSGEPYLDKPPLLYWSIMLSYKAFGVGVWQARLPICLTAFFILAACLELGTQIVGRKAALAGACLLLLSPAFLLMSRLLVLDGLITLWVLLTLLSGYLAIQGEKLHPGWWILSGLAAGLGILTKGPIALVLGGVPLFLIAQLDPRFFRASMRQWSAWLALALLVALPWFVLMALRQPNFFGHFLWEHHVLRFLKPFDHQRGVFFYVPIILGGMLPLTCLACGFFRKPASTTPGRFQNRETGFLLLSGGWCLFFFSMSGCKLPTYILPAFAPLALAFGSYLAWQWPAGKSTYLKLGGAHLVVVMLLNLGLLPWYAEYRSPLAHRKAIDQICAIPDARILCYPRESNAIAYHLKRDDLKNYRSKDFDEFREVLMGQPRTVILCTHRHSLQGLKQLLPDFLVVSSEHHCGLQVPKFLPPSEAKKFVKAMGETSLGLCDIAVVEHRSPQTIRQANFQSNPGRLPLSLDD